MTYLETKDVEIPEEIVEKWQKIVNIMAELIGVSAALIMRVKPPQIEVFRASDSEENPYEAGDMERLAGLYCEEVIKSREKLLVPNAREDERWKDSPDVELGMISYLGFPLEWPEGDIFGTICVLDSEENRFSEKNENLIKQFKELVESHLKLVYRKNELEKQIRERKEAEKKEDFLHSLLRHDVGNKIQITQGYLELAKDYNLSEEVEEHLSKAEEAVEDGREIIEKVRTLRKLSGKEETSKIDLCSTIKKAIDGHGDVFEKKDIELECQEKEIEVWGGSLLEELFSNLVENSIEHGDCDIIKIHGRVEDGTVTATVEDDGQGIPSEYREKIFERGFKGKETGGSGLGLYLVKEIAKNYGGNVIARNSELGGARFDVRLEKA